MITGSDGPWAFADPRTITHPGHALVDDCSAWVLDEAAVELTLLRSPMQLGDCLADLHALVSLLAQIHAWLPVAVAGARAQGQLGVAPATARRRYRAHVDTTTEDE